MLKVSLSHRSTSRFRVLYSENVEIRDNAIRTTTKPHGDLVDLAKYDGENWVTDDGCVWTHVEIHHNQ